MCIRDRYNDVPYRSAPFETIFTSATERQKQMLALTDWGTNSANKKAYNIFTSIVGNDFYMPKDFVHFRNANGRVAMGLHGYRIGICEYGRFGRIGMPPPFLGLSRRHI